MDRTWLCFVLLTCVKPPAYTKERIDLNMISPRRKSGNSDSHVTNSVVQKSSDRGHLLCSHVAQTARGTIVDDVLAWLSIPRTHYPQIDACGHPSEHQPQPDMDFRFATDGFGVGHPVEQKSHAGPPMSAENHEKLSYYHRHPDQPKLHKHR